MDFEDSFFDSDSEQEERKSKTKQKDKVVYNARICEIGWFVQESSCDFTKKTSPSEQASQVPDHFMLLKYRADLLYYQRDFQSSTQLYKETLSILPQISSLVKREIIDSLTRCYIHLKDYARAMETADQLVLPPHEKDSSSWKLKSLCHKYLQQYEAQVISLQKCVMLQPHHATYWLELAEGYNILRQSPDSTKEHLEHLEHILQNTVALFRPHFSWRDKTNSTAAIEMPDERRQCEQKGPNSDEHASIIASSAEQPSFAVKVDGWSVNCSDCCFSFQHSQSNDHSATDDKTSSISICPLHSPFTILMSRTLSVNEFVATLKNSNSVEGTTIVLECLSRFYCWVQCSCFLLARHILVYSAMCSNSFAKGYQSEELKKVEGLLSSCNDSIRKFLQSHFNQRSIFDDNRT